MGVEFAKFRSQIKLGADAYYTILTCCTAMFDIDVFSAISFVAVLINTIRDFNETNKR